MSSKKHFLGAILILPVVIFLLVSCGGTQQGGVILSSKPSEIPVITSTRPERPAFKGMELYSWPDEKNEWSFSILPGTNRRKSEEEIQAASMDIGAVKASFCGMAVGETVFWMINTNPTTGGTWHFPTPPQNIVTELEEQARVCQIHLVQP